MNSLSTSGVVMFWVALWLALTLAAFSAGVWVEQERGFALHDSVWVELDSANAKLDRVSDWVKECSVNHVIRSDAAGGLMAQIICPNWIEIEVDP